MGRVEYQCARIQDKILSSDWVDVAVGAGRGVSILCSTCTVLSSSVLNVLLRVSNKRRLKSKSLTLVLHDLAPVYHFLFPTKIHSQVSLEHMGLLPSPNFYPSSSPSVSVWLLFPGSSARPLLLPALCSDSVFQENFPALPKPRRFSLNFSTQYPLLPKIILCICEFIICLHQNGNSLKAETMPALLIADYLVTDMSEVLNK